jgi:hypothetical protein
MAAPRQDWLRRAPTDPAFYVLAAAAALGMVRSIDQPSLSAGLAGADVSFVPTDLAMLVLAAVCVQRLLGRGSLPRPARAPAVAAAAFSAWLVLSSAANGAAAATAAVKLLEYGVLALGVLLVVRRRVQLWQLVGVLVAISAVASVWALLGFFGLAPSFETGVNRQAAFLGQHALTTLSGLMFTFALATLYAPRHRLAPMPLVAGVSGALGIVLGAAVAGLAGVWVATAAIAVIAARRGAATRRALSITAIALLLVTAGVFLQRGRDIGGFLRSLGIAEREVDIGENVAGWNQRLIYAYVGGRVFLANPVIGTGWHGTLPPGEYERFLPDARARFPDAPSYYFPGPDGLIPQQTYDQVLYELGIVGALLFLALAFVLIRAAVRVPPRWPPGDEDEPAAYLPAAWLAVLGGSLGGAALFGGIPLTALFWLVLAVAALVPSLAPPAVARRAPV